jgi:hypothetical protein
VQVVLVLLEVGVGDQLCFLLHVLLDFHLLVLISLLLLHSEYLNRHRAALFLFFLLFILRTTEFLLLFKEHLIYNWIHRGTLSFSSCPLPLRLKLLHTQLPHQKVD